MTELGPFEFNFYAVLARYELLRNHSTAFQDFFVEVGKYRWGPDFEGRRPQGPIGDKKCDGYRPSTRTVFQCYAPRLMDAKRLTSKIEEDFNGALEHRATTPMKSWILVHNDHDELPTTAHELVIALRQKHEGDILIEVWSPQELLKLIMEIPPTSLKLLFPGGMSENDIRKINYQDIDELVASLGSLEPETEFGAPEKPSPRKLAHNRFSSPVVEMLGAGLVVEKRFSKYFAETSRATVGNRLAERFKKIYRAKETPGCDFLCVD